MQRTGRYPVKIDGDWDVDDLYILSEALQETYAYFYHLSPDTEMDDETRSRFSRYFWSHEFVGRQFAQGLYYRIPRELRLQIASMRYASPGVIEFAGVLGVLMVLPKVVSAYAKAGQDVLDLGERIAKYFKSNKLERPRRNFDTSTVTSSQIDEATDLCHELGNMLSLPRQYVDRLIDVTGTPISALKLLVALAAEARKLSDLQDQGKIELPRPEEDGQRQAEPLPT